MSLYYKIKIRENHFSRNMKIKINMTLCKRYNKNFSSNGAKNSNQNQS